jgi:regulator of CtrA degradation
MASIFFSRVYDEAFGLLVEARDYVAASMGETHISSDQRLAISCESLRLTSRLTHIMAWLLVQRAVHTGEISQTEALAEEHRLSGQNVCLTVETLFGAALPKALQSLMDRSYKLYLRIQRLDFSLSDRAPGIAC